MKLEMRQNLAFEKTDETGRLCRLNLAVHGLESEIKHSGLGNCEVPPDRLSKFVNRSLYE
jgi:hypothetical protein